MLRRARGSRRGGRGERSIATPQHGHPSPFLGRSRPRYPPAGLPALSQSSGARAQDHSRTATSRCVLTELASQAQSKESVQGRGRYLTATPPSRGHAAKRSPDHKDTDPPGRLSATVPSISAESQHKRWRHTGQAGLRAWGMPGTLPKGTDAAGSHDRRTKDNYSPFNRRISDSLVPTHKSIRHKSAPSRG